MPTLGIALDHATREVPTATAEQPAGEVRARLAGASFETAVDVAVLADDRLVGLLPIERLLAAPPDARVRDLMDPEPPIVAPGEDEEIAAWRMVDHAESSLAVVDEDHRFAGLIPPDRMLAVLLAAHDEDLARLGGYLSSTARARLSAEEPVARRLWHRLPWLLVGLVGAMLSSVVVGAFEKQLDEKVLVALFVPAVVYMADAVGTQTEAVLIRGLAVGVKPRQVVQRELVTGLVIGAIVAAVFFPFTLFAWGDGEVAAAVGLALFASCSIATLVAMILPATFQRLGLDPAFGSGPLATVIQDLLSIAVYLGIAVLVAF